jgi:hypothetical protein
MYNAIAVNGSFFDSFFFVTFVFVMPMIIVNTFLGIILSHFNVQPCLWTVECAFDAGDIQDDVLEE